MNDRNRSDPLAAFLQNRLCRRVRRLGRLQVEKARDHLHVVLHPVVYLPEEHFFFPKRGPDHTIGTPSLGNIPGVADDRAISAHVKKLNAEFHREDAPVLGAVHALAHGVLLSPEC